MKNFTGLLILLVTLTIAGCKKGDDATQNATPKPQPTRLEVLQQTAPADWPSVIARKIEVVKGLAAKTLTNNPTSVTTVFVSTNTYENLVDLNDVINTDTTGFYLTSQNQNYHFTKLNTKTANSQGPLTYFMQTELDANKAPKSYLWMKCNVGDITKAPELNFIPRKGYRFTTVSPGGRIIVTEVKPNDLRLDPTIWKDNLNGSYSIIPN